MAKLTRRSLGVIDEPYGARVSLRQCLEVVLEQAPALIDKCLDGLSAKPSKSSLTGSLGTPNFPAPIQEIVKQLVSQKQQISSVFIERLRYYIFLGVGSSVQSPQLMRFEDLKLFEEEDLDASIEIASAMHEISALTDDIMPKVDALMSSLLGWISVQPQINPLRPEIFARALRDCIKDQVSDTNLRGAILGHVSVRLGTLLAKLYTDLAQWLKSYGVEEAPTVQPLAASTTKTSTSAVSNTVARTLLTLDKLRRLLSGELDNDVRSGPDFLHTVPASIVALQDMRQVEAMVQRLEKRAKDSKDNPEAQARRKAAQARMAMTDGRELGKQLGEEVVRLMLDNLIQDDRLMPRVRALLQNIEPTLMQIAQEDGRFFSDKQHAARQFLDAVTNRSLGFSHEREEGYAPFLQSVEQSISMLHRKTAAGEAVQLAFSEVMERLLISWDRLDAQENLRRQEAARALLHAEQRSTIAQLVAQEFRNQAEGIAVPQMVLDFVCGPWAHAVAESQLRCTDGRADPQGYQSLVIELYWSVQASKAKRNRKRLVQLIPGMLAKLRQGLMTIEFPPERISDFFAGLIELHEAALEGGRMRYAAHAPDQELPLDASQADIAPDAFVDEQAQAAADRAELQALYAASTDVPLLQDVVSPEVQEPDGMFGDFHGSEHNSRDPQVWLASSEASGAGFVNEQAVMPIDPGENAAIVRSIPLTSEATVTIPIGSWVELMLDGVWVRAQLTWASPMRSLFMFISRGGKAHSMSKRTMDRLCSQGLICMVSDGLLVDKALDAVAQTALKNSVDKTRSGT
jgi:Protein of unknown function (DUF1631)